MTNWQVMEGIVGLCRRGVRLLWRPVVRFLHSWLFGRANANWHYAIYSHNRVEMPIRVVIAEGHVLVREGIRNILEQSGEITVVGEAAGGEEAVQKIVELRPDVALLDVGLPSVTGVEAARRIRALSPATAVLALTAYDDDFYVFALVEAGVAGYLLKNCHSHELIAAVRAVQAGEFVLALPVAQKVLGHYFAPWDRDKRGTGGKALSEREREVLRLAAKGMANKAIAKEMSLSPRTVQLHLAHVFRKLGVSSRTEAVTVGLRQGWLRVEDTKRPS